MNTYADAIRRQAEDAPRAALPAVTKALWAAFAEGHITEPEAEALAAYIDARRLSDAAHSGGQGWNPRGTPVAHATDAFLVHQNRPRTGNVGRAAGL